MLLKEAKQKSEKLIRKMGGPYKRKKYHYGDTHLKKNWRTKRMTRHLDQIDSDLAPENAKKLLSQPVDLDKSGNAQFYCVHCAKYMIDQRAFQDHVKGKPHKRRLHALKTEPYTIEESERAAGMGSYRAPQKRKMETMMPKAVEESEIGDNECTIKRARKPEEEKKQM